MVDKILKQAGICVIVVLLALMLQNLNISYIDQGMRAVAEQVMKEYTVEDVKTFGTKAIETIKETPSMAAGIAAAVGAETQYGQPMDELIVGPKTCVYAVGGGIVTAVGEDEQLGKYVKISHGDEAESVYGNCSKVNVDSLERVKKGQIIGEYETANPKEFYYTLTMLE